MFENTVVYNFEGAFQELMGRGFTDSFFGIVNPDYEFPEYDVADYWIEEENFAREERGFEALSHDMEDYTQYYNAVDKYTEWLTNNGILRESGDYWDVAYLTPKDIYMAKKVIRAEHSPYFLQLIEVSTTIDGRNVLYDYSELRYLYLVNHDNPLWQNFMNWIGTLPYSKELIMLEANNETN